MSSSITPQAAAQELLRRQHALKSLEAFGDNIRPGGSVEFQHRPAAHHRLIIAALERLARGEIKRLLICAPPGSAKSTYASIWFPLWQLAAAPQQNILCASNSEFLASNFNRRRRNLALSPEWVSLAGCTLSPDHQGVEHFSTQREGGIRAAGVGSSIVGFRSHLNVLDDPIASHEEALSPSQLDKQWDWYHSDFRSRLVPDGRELIVSTRWARRDIAGRILDSVANGNPEGWHTLILPLVCEHDADDPLSRSAGDRLWPEYFTEDFVAERMRSPLLWATQYQQHPLDESGSWIGPDKIVYEPFPQFNDGARAPLHYVLAMDLALSVGHGDFSVVAVCGLDNARRLHIVDLWRARVGPDEVVETFFLLCEKYEPTLCLIDDDNASKVFVRLMQHFGRLQERRPPPLQLIPMRGRDKETRAAALRGLFLSDSVRIVKGQWNAALHRELLEFPSSEHDDQVDALGLVGREFPRLSAPATPREQRTARQIDIHPPCLDELFEERETQIRLSRRI